MSIMRNNLAKDAADCLSLSYKYVSLLDCVQDQRPWVITNDPELCTIHTQLKVLINMFESRVEQLA